MQRNHYEKYRKRNYLGTENSKRVQIRSSEIYIISPRLFKIYMIRVLSEVLKSKTEEDLCVTANDNLGDSY